MEEKHPEQAGAEHNEHHHPEQLTLQVAYNGVVKPLEHVTLSELVQAVLNRALQLFNVTDRPHAQGLFREDGSEVPPTQTVKEAGLVDDQLLVLRARTPQGG